MSAQGSSSHGSGGPSVKERVKALHDHSELFETIATYPQAAIYETFPENFALALYYVQSEVHRCKRAVDCYRQENIQPGQSAAHEADYKRVMMDLVSSLLLLERFAQASRQMSSSTPPRKASMDLFRIKSRVEEPGRRGANGELAAMYGQEGDSVPPNVATVDDENLSPMARFICEWLLNPLVDYIVVPPRKLLLQLPTFKRRRVNEGNNVDSRRINDRTIEAVAEAFVYVSATLILVAPIATFTVVREQSQRLVIMPLFCLLFAASAQLMGSSAKPSFILVIA
ncbi:hypothetical protein J4E93_004683 [Alternaria ventricosa]|uniref:uncharacterized protein n=1 Tax=Alternaria ventricosa TaxID=1187951 RepID=UPI0020C57539|nr:uncharacterized protein J4E93_004683 [Alternaria ventricosa]KAI4648271.1 hypothetical protein J4E93_004683 [Alternaria ventricosa]